MSDLEAFEKRDFIRPGYEVRPALNGGFVVTSRSSPNVMSPFVAFSSADDLLQWLTSAHAALTTPLTDKQREQGRA